MIIEKKLPCGVSIEVQKYEHGFIVRMTDSRNGSWAVSAPSPNDPDAHLSLAIRTENLPVVRELLDAVDPRPTRTFGNRLRDAWRVLRGR